MLLPFTSRVSAGIVVPIPMLLPDWNKIELPSAEIEVHFGMKFVVPPPVGVACARAAGAALDPLFMISGVARMAVLSGMSGDADFVTKAEAGKPPSVSASAALRA